MFTKQWDFLKNKFEVGQLGHAYLLSGPEQTEKELFAKEFIKLINCTYRINGRQFCKTGKDSGFCQNCSMIERGAFPDLSIIKSANSESSVKNVPMVPIKSEPSRILDKVGKKNTMNISIEQIRELQNFLSYKSYYGGFKAIIIDNAERMTFEAQNCFLKTLEEPKGKTIIFLILSKPDLLLPTIISRCQEIKFFQTGKYEFSKEEQEVLKDLLSVIKSDLATKFQYAKRVNLEEGNLNKILEILQRYLRDLLLFKIGTIKTMERNFFDHYSTPRSSMTTGVPAGIDSIGILKLKQIIKLIENISHQSSTTNINPKLALEIVLMEI